MFNLTKALELTITARTSPECLGQLQEMISEAIRLDIAKNKGIGNIYKAARKLLENIKKDFPLKECLHGAWIDKISEKQYICNGYYCIEINDPIEGLQQLKDGVTAFNGRELFKHLGEYREDEKLLDVAELKVLLKQYEATAKAGGINKKANPVTQIGASFYYIRQLLDAVSVLGCEVKVLSGPKPLSPCILVSSIGRALVIPVNINK